MRDWKSMSDEEFQEALKTRSVQEGLEIMEAVGFKNTPLGQATNITPIDDWRSVGLACRFEHCILQMPGPLIIMSNLGPFNLFSTQPVLEATVCPNFNRICPGGLVQVLLCFGRESAEEEPSAPALEEVSEDQTEEVVQQ